MVSLQPVFQDRQTDCGPTAVAMLCGVTHRQAEITIYGSGMRGVTSSGKLVRAIKELGRTTLTDKCVSLDDQLLTEFDHDALLKCILISGKKEYVHWAAWDCTQEVLRDPYEWRLPLRVTHYIKVD